jgi:N-acetylglucosaminyldiphosphoundecaprenol N-acetyl-beta-D-mannosaminyltransferase
MTLNGAPSASPSPLSAAELPRYQALGVSFHPVTRASARQLLAQAMRGDRLTFVVTLGTEMVMFAQQDQAFREVVERADLVVPDGIGLVFASRLAGLPAPERVTGVDLLAELISGAQPSDSFFFYGAAPGVAALAVDNLRQSYGEFACAGVLDGYVQDEAMIVDTICQARPTVLFVALGFPRQEHFLDRHRARLQAAGVRVCVGVGGSFDAYAGTVERAPEWVQKVHLEWLYRLCKQPSRWRRMLALPRFAALVLRAPKRAVKVIAP